MDRDYTFTPLGDFPSAKLNDIQDHAAGLAQVAGFTLPIPSVSLASGTFTISPCKALVISKKCYTIASPQTFTPTGPFTANHWYHLYSYDDSGSLAYLLHSDAPDADLTYRSASTLYRYLASVPTDGSGNLLDFRKTGGRVIYTADPSTLIVLSDGTATTDTSVSCAALVPSHAFIASLEVSLTTGPGYALENGAKINSIFWIAVPPIADTRSAYRTLEVVLDSSRQFSYILNSASGSARVDVLLVGYQES